MAALQLMTIGASQVPIPSVVIRAELSDSRGNPVQGFDSVSNAYVGPSVTSTDSTGFAELDLVPNADITPIDTQYAISVGSITVRIIKSSGTETLLEALQ